MSSNNFSRRKFLQLGGAGALGILAPLSALANGKEPPLSGFLNQPELPLEVERQQLIKEVRDKALGFDIRELLYKAVGNLDFIPDVRGKIDQLLKGVDTKKGLRSLRPIDGYKAYKLLTTCSSNDCAPEHAAIRKKIDNILSTASNSISSKEKKYPHVTELYKTKISELASLLIKSTLGIDNEKLKKHVQRYPEKDMAIYYGPATSSLEFLGGLFHETFALYLQMAHGRQATELWPVDPPGIHEPRKVKVEVCKSAQGGTFRFIKSNPQLYNLHQALFNPEYQHVALVSHGSWDSYSLSGTCMEPVDVLARLLTLYNKNPEEAVAIFKKALLGNDTDLIQTFNLPKSTLSVTNELLDQWIENFCHSNGLSHREFNQRFKKSGKFVRYTCGDGKYNMNRSDYVYARRMLPKRFQEMFHMKKGSFNAKNPTFTGKYEAPFRWALDRWGKKVGRKVDVKENEGFGLPLVKDPSQLFGYEGTAWTDNYIENPIPLQGKI